MNRYAGLILGTLLAAFTLSAQTPASSSPPNGAGASFSPQFLLGSGIGFKPYQTPLKSGGSAFFDFGARLTEGVYLFSRVDMRATDAQLITGPCKTLFSSGSWLAMVCAQAGIGADANSVGSSYGGGGKLFFDVSKRFKSEHTYVEAEIGVTKATVPAPVSAAGTINPVQPDFRVGIYKAF